MSMMLKFILFAFIITTYVAVNPSVTCHNDCKASLLDNTNSLSNNKESLYPTPLTKEALSALQLKSDFNNLTDSSNQRQDSPAPASALPPYKSKRDIVEGGIEGTGKLGDTNKLFEFDDEPLTPEEEIQKNNNEEDGIEGTGRMALGPEHLIAYGPISRFGSLYVNGIKYETDQAQVDFIHQQDINQLSVGMMVKIQAAWTSPSRRTFDAQKVWFDQHLKGPVEKIAPTSLGIQLTILGTLVTLNEDTVLDNMLLKNLKVGHVLTVSGIPNTDGSLLATYVSRRSLTLGAQQIVEVESKVLAIDIAQQRIFIKGLNVNATNSKWTNTNINTLQIGDTLEALGRYNSVNHELIATSITVKNSKLNVKNGNKLSLDGVVSLFQSSSSFYLSGQKSNAKNAEFLAGSPSALNNKVRIKANGRINEHGVFIIRTIEIIQPTNASIKAPVSSVNANSSEISILGATGKTKPGTLFQSKLTNANKYFNINDISPGDWVELKGKWSEDAFTLNTVNAISAQTKRVLKGQIKKSEDGKISILGITILTNSLLTNEQTSNLSSGDFVLAKGEMLDADTFDAVHITLE